MHGETDPMRILIADDEPSIRFVLREALEADGHSVEDVEDGDAAAHALPGGDFARQNLLAFDAAVQTLTAENTQFGLGHVQPTAMLGRVVDFQSRR